MLVADLPRFFRQSPEPLGLVSGGLGGDPMRFGGHTDQRTRDHQPRRVLNGHQSCRTMLRRELLILSPPLYSMSPSFRNLFMKKFTRARVAPIISASVSCEIFGSVCWGIDLAVARQQQQRPGEALFAGVEQLIDEVRFDAHVPRQHVGDEAVRERGLFVEQLDHRLLLDDQHARRDHRRGRPDANRLARQGALAKKSPGDSIATPASLPIREITESLIPPFWMYLNVVAGITLREHESPR